MDHITQLLRKLRMRTRGKQNQRGTQISFLSLPLYSGGEFLTPRSKVGGEPSAGGSAG